MKTSDDILENLLDFIVYEKSFRLIDNGIYTENLVKVRDILDKVKQLKEEQKQVSDVQN